MRKVERSAWIRRLTDICGLRGALVGWALLALLLSVGPAVYAQHSIVRLPFRSVNGLILVEAKVNGNPVTLVMDTGANHTIINPRSCGYSAVPGFEAINRGVGVSGNALRIRVDLEVGKQYLFSQPVSVMNLEDLTRRLGTSFDGLLGQDILRQFRSIRIDYKAHFIELQQ